MNLEDLCEPFDPDDYADDREALARYYVDLDEAYQLIRKQRDIVGTELTHRLQDVESVHLPTATLLLDRRRKIDDTAQQVREKVYPQIKRFLVDPETGDNVEAIVLDDALQLMEFKRSPKYLAPFGVHTVWTESVKVIRR